MSLLRRGRLMNSTGVRVMIGKSSGPMLMMNGPMMMTRSMTMTSGHRGTNGKVVAKHGKMSSRGVRGRIVVSLRVRGPQTQVT